MTFPLIGGAYPSQLPVLRPLTGTPERVNVNPWQTNTTNTSSPSTMDISTMQLMVGMMKNFLELVKVALPKLKSNPENSSVNNTNTQGNPFVRSPEDIRVSSLNTSGKMGTLKPEDKAAVVQAAKELGLDPHELWAFILFESKGNPNIWGGGGGKYFGLIQFGPSEQKKYLNANKIKNKNYTIAEQMPAVVAFLKDRGYKPGMGILKAYNTVLGGNPNANPNAKDANGTSANNAVARFQPGGELHKQAQKVLGDVTT